MTILLELESKTILVLRVCALSNTTGVPKLIDLSELSFDIVLADMQGMSVYDFQFSKRTILVLGNEGLGLSKHINSGKYKTISIPMKASVESLNVAITAGILSYRYNAQFKI